MALVVATVLVGGILAGLIATGTIAGGSEMVLLDDGDGEFGSNAAHRMASDTSGPTLGEATGSTGSDVADGGESGPSNAWSTQASDNESGDALSPGAHLSGLIAVQNESVNGLVALESFRRDLENADGEAERAAIIDSQLTAIDRRLDRLEASDPVTDPMMAGNGGQATHRTVETEASLRTIVHLLSDAEATIEELPPALRDDRNLSTRLANLQERVATLQDESPGTLSTIDGEGIDRRTEPLTLDDVDRALSRGLSLDAQAERLFGSETIDLRVRRANGSVLRATITTEDGEVTELRRGPADDPSVHVYTDYQLVHDLRTADDPAAEIRAAMDEDRFVYDGVGIGNSVRYGIATIADALPWT